MPVCLCLIEAATLNALGDLTFRLIDYSWTYEGSQVEPQYFPRQPYKTTLLLHGSKKRVLFLQQSDLQFRIAGRGRMHFPRNLIKRRINVNWTFTNNLYFSYLFIFFAVLPPPSISLSIPKGRTVVIVGTYKQNILAARIVNFPRQSCGSLGMATSPLPSLLQRPQSFFDLHRHVLAGSVPDQASSKNLFPP